MRTGKLLAIAAGAAFVLAPVMVKAECFGHKQSVKIKQQTVQVESSKPVVKPVDKKS